MSKLDESKRVSVRPSELLAAAAAIAAGTQAYGEVIIFINPPEGEPGHFDWTWGPDGFPGTPAQWLDITRPSTEQGGGLGPSSVGQLYYGYSVEIRVYTTGGAMVATGTWTSSLPSGTAIDGQLDFLSSTVHASIQFGGPPYYDPGLYTQFLLGVPSYMAVRFADFDGFHYGWIGVVRGPDYWDLDFDAFAWGYETEPGVPVIAGIPAPGTLAALAFGAVVTRRGRKREES